MCAGLCARLRALLRPEPLGPAACPVVLQAGLRMGKLNQNQFAYEDERVLDLPSPWEVGWPIVFVADRRPVGPPDYTVYGTYRNLSTGESTRSILPGAGPRWLVACPHQKTVAVGQYFRYATGAFIVRFD